MTPTPLTYRPPRVLHVIDLPGAGWDSLSAAAHCAATLAGEADQRLLLIGDAHAARDAAAFGLIPTYRICPPLNRLAAAVAPLDRLFRSLARVAPVDIVHVWSDSARVICRETLAFTLPITQSDPAPFVQLPTTAAVPGDRAAIRSAHRIGDHEVAVLLAADRPGVGDARRFAGLVGILHLAGITTVGLASSRCDNARRAARFLRGFHREWDVIPLSSPPHLSLPAADVVIYDQGDTLTADSGPGPRTGGIVVAAAAAGIPVVATDSPLARRLLGPLAQNLIAANGLMPELARIMVPLCESRERRETVGRELRALSPSFLSPTSTVLQRWHAELSRGAAA